MSSRYTKRRWGIRLAAKQVIHRGPLDRIVGDVPWCRCRGWIK